MDLEALTNALAERVAAAVAQRLAEHAEAPTPWLDVPGAATYLVTTERGVRGLVLRRAIPFEKTPNGRILFSRQELAAWEPGENDAWFHARAVLRSYARDAPDFAYDWD